MLRKIIYLYFINYINSIICYVIYYFCIIRNEVITIKRYMIKAKKKIDEKKTLKYAVAFYFCTSGKINFILLPNMKFILPDVQK